MYDDQVSYVFSLSEQPPFVYGETSITADTRDHRSHPTRGSVYRAAFVRYSDRDAGTFTFNRAETEAAHFVPLANARVVLAMHGWFVATGTDDGKMVPFYLEPSLGGNNTLRGYSDYRFHDRNLLVFNVESRLGLMTHVDLAVFADAGNVASRVGDLNLDKTSFGVGLRLHSQKSTFARFEIAHGAEGWSYTFRMNDPLHLARLSKRTASIPFVP
jgi:outer membrane protein assembly factor BamA